MRLWSLHPRYLDPKGLVALWREALLAQAVLRGATTGYRNHPQLERFRAQDRPDACIAEYLRAVHAESVARGYRFDAGRIADGGTAARIDVTAGQVAFEWGHLMAKLADRAPDWHARLARTTVPTLHPIMRRTVGGIADWERARDVRGPAGDEGSLA